MSETRLMGFLYQCRHAGRSVPLKALCGTVSLKSDKNAVLAQLRKVESAELRFMLRILGLGILEFRVINTVSPYNYA